MVIQCNGYEATVVFPKAVPVNCCWCEGFIRMKEVDSSYPAEEIFGICDPCALAQLPPHLHSQWDAIRRQDAVAGMEQVGSRWGEQLYQEVP